MQKIRLLEVIPSCQRGGVPTVVHNLIAGLNKDKFDTQVVAPNDGPFYQKLSRLCPVHDIAIRGYYPTSLSKLRRLIKTERINIVHAHGKGAGFYGRLASLGLNAKTVYTLHGFHCEHYRPWFKHAYLAIEKLLVLITDQTIAVSEGEKEQAERAGILIQGKHSVILNGIAFDAIEAPRPNRYVMGTLSRNCYQKGLEFLLEAVATAKKKCPDLICRVAGGTPKGEETYEAALEKKAHDLGVVDNIVFLGEINDIAGFFSELDLYISTSRWEGLPTAIIESFASRVPVVATDVVGNRDLVKNNETGVLVATENSAAIARGIEHAFENPDEMATMAEKAYFIALRDYSVESMVRSHESLYERLLDSGKAKNGSAVIR
jgi:glycosyltransferase involved in cell wall biosynthesis